jgi:hypothetical protein
VGVVVGVLILALVFAVDAGLRSAGIMSYAGAGGGPAGYVAEGGISPLPATVEKDVDRSVLG